MSTMGSQIVELNPLCDVFKPKVHQYDIIVLRSGFTCGRVVNREVYARRLQKFIYLHLSTNINISLHSSGLCKHQVFKAKLQIILHWI